MPQTTTTPQNLSRLNRSANKYLLIHFSEISYFFSKLNSLKISLFCASLKCRPEIKSNDDEEDANDNAGGYDGKPKCPRGTRDYGPGDMIIREQMMTSIKRNFNKFGGQFMETPVFELRDILMDKYGEDEKLIYDLAKQEQRHYVFDMFNVPLARYIAMNRKDIKSPFKAARVGRVYRRDQPYMTKGRLKNFGNVILI